ncbi:hypothetical protein MUK42_33352 [Musa troglodytarum]|uniref:Uncharacterized protein n=1 Tax=Musa troglodytarum TaxID=320322 RepID=A0A9E7IGT6_9LILI|nr:hypothetical protein MUK42_33352 [Musa troglodytarum]
MVEAVEHQARIEDKCDRGWASPCMRMQNNRNSVTEKSTHLEDPGECSTTIQQQNEKDLYLQLLEDCTSVAQLKLEERQKGEGEESSSRIVLASKHMLQHIPI